MKKNEKILLEPCASYEGSLQTRWNEVPLNIKFTDTRGREVVILSRGTWNLESGPDFKNARVRIAGDLFSGDVEIHVKRSDWDRHKHSPDPAYANVILHVVEQDDAPIRDDLPTLLLPGGKKVEQAPSPAKTPYGECVSLFERMESEELVRFFRDAGLDRLREKSQEILQSMIRDGVRRAYLSKLFEQLGSKKNRVAMQKVFSAAAGKYPEDIFAESYEAVIWGESGLLPPDDSRTPDTVSADLLHRLWSDWWALRPDSSESPLWKRDGMRPLNSPEREIASVVEFIRKHGISPLPGWADMLMNSANASVFAEKLVHSFIIDEPFWNTHTSFASAEMKNPARVIGENKARMLAIDVAVPCLAAYARLIKDEKLLDRVFLAAANLPKTESNRITKDAFIRWFRQPSFAEKTLSDACSRQGVLHLYKKFCSAVGGNCGACKIRNSFNE